MELKRYINILWRRKWALISAILVVMIAMGVYTRTQIPKYRTSTVLRIATSASGSLSYSDYVHATQLMNTYVEIATSRSVLSELKSQLNLKYLPTITVETIPNTELISISVESVYPDRAMKVANSLAELLVSESSELYLGGGKSSREILKEQLAKSQTDLNYTRNAYERLIIQTPVATGKIETTRQLLQLKQNVYTTLLGQYTQAVFQDEIRSGMITVIEPALVPQIPFEPRVSLNYALGFAVGLMGGLGLAFFIESQDNPLYKFEEFKTIVGLDEIAKIPKASRKQLSSSENDFSKLANAFQNLAFNLQPAKGQPQKNILLIISAEPNQGKSTIVHRLAFTLAELGKKVIAIDCDNHTPKLHSLFGLSNDSGLTEVLEEKTTLEDALQTGSHENVKLLASGTSSSQMPKLLRAPQMETLLNDLKNEFDYILLDTSTLLAASGITTIIPIVDKVLLVARNGYAHHEALSSIKKVLADIIPNDKPVDLIINQAEFSKGL